MGLITSFLDILLDFWAIAEAVLEHYKAVYALALNRVRTGDSSGLCHRLVLHDGRLDLGRRQQVARHVEHIVRPTGDPVVSVSVAIAA